MGKKSSFKRNCFNGYLHCKYFYQIRALVSKRAIFNTLFFGGDDMLNEFCNDYSEIIKKYERNTGTDIKNAPSDNFNNFFAKTLNTIGVGYANHHNIEKLYKYEKILDSILLEAFQKKINSLTTKDELLEETIEVMYYDSYMYINNGKYVDSEEKKKYLELYKKVKELNKNLPDKPKTTTVAFYGIYDVNVIQNPKHNMKIMIYIKDDKVCVNEIELVGSNDVDIIKEKNSICQVTERYLNRYVKILIDKPNAIFNMLNDMRSYVPEITISKSNGQYSNRNYKIR